MPPKELVPVVPEWCDCTFRNHCPKKSTTFLATCRIVLAMVSLILCIIFIVKPYGISEEKYPRYDVSLTRGILGTICVVNFFHLGAAVFLLYLVKSNANNTRQIRRWLLVDLIITGAYVTCVIILLFSLPPSTLYLILGFKLIFLSLLFCYRSGATYLIFRANEKNTVLVHVASPDGVVTNHYDNVYRV